MGQQQAKKQAGLSDQRPVTALRLAQGIPAEVEDRGRAHAVARTLEKAMAPRTRCRLKHTTSSWRMKI
jgi:hypothetical protein